jgi:hypothetical protein
LPPKFTVSLKAPYLITDFSVRDGDRIQLVGYGSGATFQASANDPSTWIVRSRAVLAGSRSGPHRPDRGQANRMLDPRFS